MRYTCLLNLYKVSSFDARKARYYMSLAGKVIVSVGGSSGIGAGIVRRSAQERAKTIILVGRNQSKLNQVVEEARNAFARHNTGSGAKNAPDFKPIVADLGTIQGIKDAVKEVERISQPIGGVDYLFQSQGATPNGILSLNKDGLDTQFTTQCLSKFAFAYLLAESGTLKHSVVNICAPGGTGTVDLDDIDLQNAAKEGRYGRGLRDVSVAGNLGSNVIDAITLETADRYPQLSATHTFPGIVAGGDSIRNFPFAIRILAQTFIPVFAFLRIVDTPDRIAPKFIRFASEKDGGIFSAPSPDKKIAGSPWALEKVNREKLWDKLESLLQL